ncbi:MAG: YjjG family noncanonical pyrimidine nucleotidase [Chloroflexota bacterium]
MNKKYQWLLFDADGTLFDYTRAEALALEKTFRHLGAPFEQKYLDAYQQINREIWRALEQKQIAPDVLRVRRFEMLFEKFGIAISPVVFSEAYLKYLADCGELIEGAQDVLDALSAKYRFAILTNGLQAVQQSRLAHSPIRDHIAAFIISEEVGFAKPERGFFDAAFARIGNPSKERALMIGDSISSDIQGASDYGIATCWYNPERQPRPASPAITYEITHLRELIALLIDEPKVE